MNRDLPPLTALRAFEAAARHMSFARAAEELHVTPAALSFQIKSLEQHLGRPVFRRLNRAIELTEAGRILLPGTRDGFNALSASWRTVREFDRTDILRVTAGPAFTAKWLAPRLYNFAQDHPDIELRFSASMRLIDLHRDEIDVAIRYGDGRDEGAYSQELIHDWVTPMMSPVLAKAYPTQPDMKRATLLHQDLFPFDQDTLDWNIWFRDADIGPIPPGGPRFSQADHALDAAIAGSGIVLGRYALAESALRAGLLVAPYKTALYLPYKFRFVCAEGVQKKPHIAAFETWIKSEVADMVDLRNDFTFNVIRTV